jgi:hypothetical protein
LLKALEAVSARPDAAAVLGNLTTVIPKEQFDIALTAPGAQPGSILGTAVDAIKNLIAPPAQPAQPVQPMQPPKPGQPPAQPVQPPQFVGTASP